MGVAEIGLIVFILFSLISSVGFHSSNPNREFKSYAFRSILAAITANICFQIYDYAYHGGLPKFALIAFIFGGLYSFLIAMIVSIPFWLYRRRNKIELG